jgi:4-hydroxy-2-oxoglutarate aldolase
MRLHGIFAPATTPFDPATGELDLAGFRRNATFLLDAPLAGLVLFGSTGEGVFVDEDERTRLLEAARGMMDGRLLLAGTGAESTRATIRLTRAAAAAGADAVLVQPPGFFRPFMTPAALEAHYTAVADASPVPVVIYQVPVPFRSVDLDLALIARLSRHPNIVGVKDSTGDLAALGELVRTSADGSDDGSAGGFAVLVGTAAVLHDALGAGAVGGILGAAVVAPAECAEIYDLWRRGERAEAERLQTVVAPLHRAVVAKFGVPGVKAALDFLGLAGGPPRPPLQPLGAVDRAAVEAALSQLRGGSPMSSSGRTSNSPLDSGPGSAGP